MTHADDKIQSVEGCSLRISCGRRDFHAACMCSFRWFMSINAKLGMVTDDPQAERSRVSRVGRQSFQILHFSSLNALQLGLHICCSKVLAKTWVNDPGLKLACDWLLKRAAVPKGVLCPHALTFSSHADHGCGLT